jgi:4-diphosphocytidyl-2-C-methyl-D-erythritol kinase
VSSAHAYAKVNLALVVGPLREDGKHELATVLQLVDLHDDVEIEPAETLRVTGFEADTIVANALRALADAAGVTPAWEVRIEKRIPVAAGLGGGSSDAATALSLANALLPRPLPFEELDRIAARIGADVPFFLRRGPQLGWGDGTELSAVDLPQDYVVLLALEEGAVKASTTGVYRGFDERSGAVGFEERRATLASALTRVESARDLAAFPPNDLASSPLADELGRLGAFRADVSGAGPVVYGLFEWIEEAQSAGEAVHDRARTWLARPVAGD